MVVIASVLIALAHLYLTNGLILDEPISLGILRQDLESLESQYPRAELWPESKIIQYTDKLQITVSYDYQTAEITGGGNYLVVLGNIKIAKQKILPNGSQELSSQQDIRQLIFSNGLIFFDDARSEPVKDLDQYFIVNYEPPSDQVKKKPAIEYLSLTQFESELLDLIHRIRYERSVTEVSEISTYVRTKNGVKLNARFDEQSNTVVFKADFHILARSERWHLIEKTISFDSLTYSLHNGAASIEFLQVGLNRIIGIKVISFDGSLKLAHEDSLRVKRSILLKDVLDSQPTNEPGKSSGTAVIRYEHGKVLTVNNIHLKTKTVLGLSGKFEVKGVPFDWICLAFPESEHDKKGVNGPNRSLDNLFTEPVFFSCPKDDEDYADVFLQEDEDYIEIGRGEEQEIAVISGFTNVEPFLRYISYEHVLRTLTIVSDAMTILCADGSRYRSYRLYTNVFLNYDCEAQRAYFDSLDLWFRPGSRKNSTLVENLHGVVYNSKTERFESENQVLTNFKLRQLYPVFPYKVPTNMWYMSYNGNTNIAVELKSIEWDLHITRENLFKNPLPQWGVIRVDNSVLFYAEKSNEVIDGQKTQTIVVKCDVVETDTCTQSNQRECMKADVVIYDGTKIMMRNSQENNSSWVPSEVYWPKFHQLPIWNDIFSVSYEINYVLLSSFRKHMKKLSERLQNRCIGTTSQKLTFYLYYFASKGLIVGYYDCELHYLFFISDFKIIKLPNIHGVSTSYQLGEETNTTPVNTEGSSTRPLSDDINNHENVDQSRPASKLKPRLKPEDEQMRRKYSDYILDDLIYDPIGLNFHSRSMFLAEVYALRVIPANVRLNIKESPPYRFMISGGPEVFLYEYNVHNNGQA